MSENTGDGGVGDCIGLESWYGTFFIHTDVRFVTKYSLLESREPVADVMDG